MSIYLRVEVSVKFLLFQKQLVACSAPVLDAGEAFDRERDAVPLSELDFQCRDHGLAPSVNYKNTCFGHRQEQESSSCAA